MSTEAVIQPTAVQPPAIQPDSRAARPDLLPGGARVLVVTARPGQEAADLGGLVYAFRRAGASLSLLCLTRGETRGDQAEGDLGGGAGAGRARLEAAQPWEVQLSASILGIRQVTVASYRGSCLHHYRQADLTGRISQEASARSADLILVVAPETGDIGDRAVARAATAAGLQAGVPVAGRTRPGVSGAWVLDLGRDAEVARAIQKSAAAAHATQADALPDVVSRLDQLGRAEALRWLLSPIRLPGARPAEVS
jgi:LmbE family N-acetylglucosaminyl deacetylase